MKNIKPLIREILVIGIILLIMFLDFEKIIPGFSYLIPIIFILGSLYSLIKRIKYHRNEKNNYVGIETSNDSYYRTTPFIFGTIILIGSIISKIYFTIDLTLFSLLITLGLFQIIIGLFFIPSGLISFTTNSIKFQIENFNEQIQLETIEKIELFRNSLTINKINGETSNINFVNLTDKDKTKLENLLNENLVKHN
ncbi:hypothetical protein [Lutibacter citreus]|uniref:hypothetical protein n=1 Tax=Lutibacter citreus TaxID=2138210 RepID=UPI0013004FD2|nr:hypothetical protein [Lutibacter citreus]